MTGTNPTHANARGNKTISGTDISVRAILPKKNPVPHRHPAVARARMGMTRPCGSNIASDCRAGVNEHPSGTVRNVMGLQSRLAKVRRFRSATNPVPLPKPKPRTMSEHFVVPSIRSREIAWAQRSGVRHGEDALQPLDFGNRSLGIHAFHHLVRSGSGSNVGGIGLS